MMTFLQKPAVWVALLCATFALSVSAQDKNWRPVKPEDLASKTPVVEPDADAEAIFWEVRVDDSAVTELALRHYVRVKIFTERGREQFSKHDIVFPKRTQIKDVEARVTKPDGTVVMLKKEDVRERDIVKTDGFKIKAKSFALPGLEVGSIVEYRYKEVVENAEANLRLMFQREIPIQTISYYVRPYSGTRAMAFQAFNTGDTNFVKDKDGFHRATMNNLRAFKEEANMVPENEVRSWIYIYYIQDVPKNSNEYWARISKLFFDVSKNTLKPNDEIKAATAQVIAGATTDEEKLHKIFDYVKTQIKNVSYAADVSEEEKKIAAKETRSAGDVLKRKVGSAGDVDILFGAMAKAAGFDARLAFSGNRSEVFFNPNVANLDLMLGSGSIAVKVADKWRFFSPASYYTPYGMMSWIEEDQTSLVTDSKELIWQQIPLSPSEKSLEKRTGTFKMLEDGTLEGEVRIELTGHNASIRKSQTYQDSAAEQEKNFKERLKASVMPTAEIESLAIENARDPEKPLVYTFKIRVPGYASRTGKRLFFQPNVFERGASPRFISSKRKHDIYFSYPFAEMDEITIELPAGFKLESADAPNDIADKQRISSHATELNVTADGKTLTYKRNFSFGNGGFLRFPPQSYSVMKNMFESFHRADAHQLTLRQDAK